jgi:hypothetical protein
LQNIEKQKVRFLSSSTSSQIFIRLGNIRANERVFSDAGLVMSAAKEKE